MYWHALEYCNRLCVYIECFTNTNECMQALLAAVVMTKRLTLNSTSRNPSCRSRSPRGRASQGGTCGTGFCKAETGSQGTDYRQERRGPCGPGYHATTFYSGASAAARPLDERRVP